MRLSYLVEWHEAKVVHGVFLKDRVISCLLNLLQYAFSPIFWGDSPKSLLPELTLFFKRDRVSIVYAPSPHTPPCVYAVGGGMMHIFLRSRVGRRHTAGVG